MKKPNFMTRASEKENEEFLSSKMTVQPLLFGPGFQRGADSKGKKSKAILEKNRSKDAGIRKQCFPFATPENCLTQMGNPLAGWLPGKQSELAKCSKSPHGVEVKRVREGWASRASAKNDLAVNIFKQRSTTNDTSERVARQSIIRGVSRPDASRKEVSTSSRDHSENAEKIKNGQSDDSKTISQNAFTLTFQANLCDKRVGERSQVICAKPRVPTPTVEKPLKPLPDKRDCERKEAQQQLIQTPRSKPSLLVDSCDFVDRAFTKMTLIFGENRSYLNREQLVFFLNRLGMVGELSESWKCLHSKDEKLVDIIFHGLGGESEKEVSVEIVQKFLSTSLALQRLGVWTLQESPRPGHLSSRGLARNLSLSNKTKTPLTVTCDSKADKFLEQRAVEESDQRRKQSKDSKGECLRLSEDPAEMLSAKFTPISKSSRYNSQDAKGPSLHPSSLQFSFRKIGRFEEASVESKSPKTEVAQTALDIPTLESTDILSINRPSLDELPPDPVTSEAEAPSSNLLSRRAKPATQPPRSSGRTMSEHYELISNRTSLEVFNPVSEALGCHQQKQAHQRELGAYLFSAELAFNGEKKAIHIYENINIQEVIQDFIEDHNLKSDMYSPLIELLKQRQSEIINEKRREESFF